MSMFLKYLKSIHFEIKMVLSFILIELASDDGNMIKNVFFLINVFATIRIHTQIFPQKTLTEVSKLMHLVEQISELQVKSCSHKKILNCNNYNR